MGILRGPPPPSRNFSSPAVFFLSALEFGARPDLKERIFDLRRVDTWFEVDLPFLLRAGWRPDCAWSDC